MAFFETQHCFRTIGEPQNWNFSSQKASLRQYDHPQRSRRGAGRARLAESDRLDRDARAGDRAGHGGGGTRGLRAGGAGTAAARRAGRTQSRAPLCNRLPAAALDDALRKLTRPTGSTLEARNRTFHRLLVDGVTVEYPLADGAMRGVQARVVDFENPDANDWLAVNQFSVSENKNTRRADIVLFVNGLPLAVIACWSSSRIRQTRRPQSGRPGSNCRRTKRSNCRGRGCSA